MAKGQSGSGAITVWMIIFVGLWLASTVFLVIMYTNQQDLVSENTQLRAAKDKLISAQQERSLELVRQANAGGPTVVGLLEEARSQLAEIATGSASDDAATVRSKRDQLLDSFRVEGLVDDPRAYSGQSLQAALAKLYDDYRSLHQDWKTAQEQLTQAQSELTTLREVADSLRAEYAAKSQELTEQLAGIEAGRDDYRNQRDQQIAQMEKDYEEARALNTEILTQARQDLQTCTERLTEAQERFSLLRAKLGGLMQSPEELATARRPDGKVLTAVPGDDVVYINLGKSNGLTLGLQFTVYSAETGIPASGEGKARVEVVSISEGSAECRIVAVARNQIILEGDLIANPVYDPNRSLEFVVVGQFDTDYDGVPDRQGAETIKSLVTGWGGRVVEDISPVTDFVVVGIAPRRPRPAVDVPADQQELNRMRQAAWDAYQKVITDAQVLGIPVLTQDVFLTFLGEGVDRVSRR